MFRTYAYRFRDWGLVISPPSGSGLSQRPKLEPYWRNQAWSSPLSVSRSRPVNLYLLTTRFVSCRSTPNGS